MAELIERLSGFAGIHLNIYRKGCPRFSFPSVLGLRADAGIIVSEFFRQ